MTESYPGAPTPVARPQSVLPLNQPLESGEANGIEWLRRFSWRQFEDLIGNAYRLRGYNVLKTADHADGGIDLILTRGSDRIFVQCKHWKAWQVPVSVVRELFGVVVANKASGGIVVTSGKFSRDARAFAQQSGVTLLDGPAVLHLVAVGRALPLQQQHSALQAAPPQRHLLAPLGAPPCPICLSPMVMRRARRGQRAGSMFWGCTRYPGCKGIIEAPGLVGSSTHRGTSRPASGTRRPRAPKPHARLLLGLVLLLAAPPLLLLVWIAFSAALLSPTAHAPAGPSARSAPSIAKPPAGGPSTAAPKELGQQPMDIAIDTVSKRLYTANFVSGDVSVLDANTLQVVDTIDVPGQPVAIAVDPKRGRIFVADNAAEKIYSIDTKTGRKVATLRSGHLPVDVAYDGARQRLYVANSGSKSIWAYNTATNRRITSVDTLGEPLSLAIDAPGGKLYVLSSMSVFAYPTATLVRDPSPYLGMFGENIAVDPHGQRLYVARNGSISEQNLLTGKVKNLDYEGDVPSLCIDPATRTAYLADPDGNVIRQLRLK